MADSGSTTGRSGWRPRLVLFDLDDTLCDYSAARLARLRAAFTGPDRDAPFASGDALDRLIEASLAIQPHGADHFAELSRVHGIGDRAAARCAEAWYVTNRFHGLQVYGDAFATIEAIRIVGAVEAVRVGIVTNGPAEVQRAKIELLGVDGIADFVLISGEFGAWKPERAIFEEAMRLGDARPEETVMIGDSLAHDVAGAHAVGARSIWINRDGRSRLDDEPKPDEEASSLADVPRVLERWRSGSRRHPAAM